MRGLFIVALSASAALPLFGCKPPTPPADVARPASSAAPAEDPARALRPPQAFASIADPAARSVALFTEAGRVVTHPHCTNCHPADGIPRQGMDQHIHVPIVAGGPEGHGIPGLPCTSCHQPSNTPVVGGTLASVPGNPKWALAPSQMAWIGKSLGQICAQIKDPSRNGGKSLSEIQHHMAEDVLVSWGFDPGPGRTKVPGTQKALGELIQAWIDTGARCPAP